MAGLGRQTRGFLFGAPLTSAVIFCAFLICLTLPFSPLYPSKFPKILWYVFCGFS
jgi:hypothetical protein